MRSIANLLITT